MRPIKRRKVYLEAGDDRVNDTAKYRMRMRKGLVLEDSIQTAECSNVHENQSHNDNIPFGNECVEPNEMITSDGDDSAQDGIDSEREEFDISMISSSNPENLHDLLQTPGFCDPVSTPVERSPAELLLMVLKFSILHKLPLTSTSNLLKLINSIFAMPVTPESRYMIDKFCNSKDDAEFHATCANCSMYIGKLTALGETAECTNCNAVIDVGNPSSPNYFVIVDPSNAVADYLNAYQDHYSYVMRERCHEKDHFKDVYDGKCYRHFVNNLPECTKRQYATATFNTDGAPVFESSAYSIWPIYLMLNELPAEHRSNHLIVCGLWFGKCKPQMSIFLDSFVEKMNEISDSGIRCLIKGETLTIKLYALICCVDTVARAPMNGTMQFNAYFGCDWCLHPGEWLNGSMRYPILDYVVENRDRDSTIKLMKEAVQKGLPICGVKNPSPLIYLENFEFIEGFVPDHLHCSLDGVGKQLTEYSLRSMSTDDLKLVENRLSKIKAPNQVGRLSRPLKDRAQWKAREWENWVLYYSIPVLESVLEKKILKHWSLFVESLHVLLSNDITSQQLDNADRMLHEFVCGVEQIYSKSAMTYNVHQLLHLAKSVYNWGPLWAHSTFPFESGNHQLLSAIQCAKGVNQQILRYINMHRSVDILEKSIYPYSSNTVKQYCSGLGKPSTKKCLQKCGITYFGKTDGRDKRLLNKFELSSSTKIFMRIVKNDSLYASREKVNLRSCNSFAQLVNKNFIHIIKFAVDEEKNEQLVLCNLIKTNSSEFAQTLKEVIRIDSDVLAVNVTDIDRVCVFIHVADKQYISSVPNLYKY